MNFLPNRRTGVVHIRQDPELYVRVFRRNLPGYPVGKYHQPIRLGNPLRGCVKIAGIMFGVV